MLRRMTFLYALVVLHGGLMEDSSASMKLKQNPCRGGCVLLNTLRTLLTVLLSIKTKGTSSYPEFLALEFVY
eukprot:m.4507 g.4507  ORF g.4507 m.4507 type:complete len:72 (+) comp3002_c0_seq1:143-358(+)